MNQPETLREHKPTRRMLTKLDRLYQSLETQKTVMLTYLDALSDQESNRKPTYSDWSPLEVMEHVVMVEEWVSGPNEALPPASGRVLMKGHLFIILGGGLTRAAATVGFRIPTFPVAEPRGADLNFTAIKRRWDSARHRLLPKLEAVTPETLLLPIAIHPVAGPLNAKQALSFLNVHLAYHWRHLPRVKSR